eukprot:81925-Pyramimonas_sp.AAC.1
MFLQASSSWFSRCGPRGIAPRTSVFKCRKIVTQIEAGSLSSAALALAPRTFVSDSCKSFTD